MCVFVERMVLQNWENYKISNFVVVQVMRICAYDLGMKWRMDWKCQKQLSHCLYLMLLNDSVVWYWEWGGNWYWLLHRVLCHLPSWIDSILRMSKRMTEGQSSTSVALIMQGYNFRGLWTANIQPVDFLYHGHLKVTIFFLFFPLRSAPYHNNDNIFL